MKYSANPGSISAFVVGGTGSEYGLPVAVSMKLMNNSTFGVRISWWGQAFVIDIIEAFFAGKGLGR
ncbi:hypothetical protein [Desulfocicer vacuolatum]|uniref:hypothetical protein n=1 Tax=Desulfocicer vacuolatum TaxID=2298 RepID=UPI000A04C979|nr:hypothetical protein [Desulfocicer vacuolatum]